LASELTRGRLCNLLLPNTIIRNYPLFGALAGVRYADIPVVAAPRGLPQDATGETQAFYEKWASSLAHSASWVSRAELIEAVERSRIVWEENRATLGRAINEVDQWRETCVQAILTFMGTYEANQFETRMVFFFDN